MKIKEWLAVHYKEICFEVLQGNAKEELFSYLLPKKNAIVVMGSYGRSSLSLLFKKSTADLILKTTNLPLFITHH